MDMRRRLELMAGKLGLAVRDGSPAAHGRCAYAAASRGGEDIWVAAAERRSHFPEGLIGETHGTELGFLMTLPLRDGNFKTMRRILPWASPSTLRDEPVTCLIRPDGDGRTPAGLPPVLRLPSGADADAALNRHSFRQLRDGDHRRFATECRGGDPGIASACGATRFVWELRAVAEAEHPIMREELAEEYAGRCFIVAGAALRFSGRTASDCVRLYAGALARARELVKKPECPLKERLLLSLRLPELSAEEEAPHFFFLLRELRRLGLPAPGLAPRRPALDRNLAAVLRFHRCLLVWDFAENPPGTADGLAVQISRV